MSWFYRLLPVAVAMTAIPAWAQTDAADLRWFEVEVLVIKHQQSDGPLEHFEWLPPGSVSSRAHDLLSRYYAPNFWALLHQLPECPRDNWQTIFSGEQQLPCHDWAELDLPDGQDWYQPQRILASFTQAPVVIDGGGGDMTMTNQPFLMPASTHQLADLRQQLIRRKVATPLLHVSYRQPVFTRNQNFQMRLFGGRNYADTFLANGYQLPPRQLQVTSDDEQLRDPLQQLLELQQQGQLTFRVQQADTPPPPPSIDRAERSQQPVWELDGLLHIYLVANYLHIDSKLQYREPQPVIFSSVSLTEQAQAALQQGTNNLFLRRFELDQLRRVISHETHYFDHPKFALVVQIRRTELSARR
jgi:hypothetical protein